MNRNLKILLAAILVTTFFTQNKICEHLGFGQPQYHKELTDGKQPEELDKLSELRNEDFFINDSLYTWDETIFNWVPVGATKDFQALLSAYSPEASDSSQPIEIDWKVLMDIQYRLRYFEELDMEIYAPVFGKAQKMLNGKEVIIKGFIIPLDEAEGLLMLSANPYASCFFCGKASPASVVSLYLRKKGKRYKIDDFKKIVGTLHLNHDDPNEFYYILKDAREK